MERVLKSKQTKSKPKIFVTNDDGIQSPGLKGAVSALVDLGVVTVVAPSTQQTAMGQSHRCTPEATLVPVHMEANGVSVEAYSCDCSPAVAVRHGLDVLFREAQPDLLVAGINYGENLGFNVGISGTLGAAFEGAGRGIPAIAISKQTDIASHRNHTLQNWEASAHFLNLFAKRVLACELPFDVDVIKIDVPDDATPQTPWHLTRLARQSYYIVDLPNPGVGTRVSDGIVRVNAHDAHLLKGTDIYAVAIDRIVSVTPLTIDSTSRSDFSDLQRIFED